MAIAKELIVVHRSLVRAGRSISKDDWDAIFKGAVGRLKRQRIGIESGLLQSYYRKALNALSAFPLNHPNLIPAILNGYYDIHIQRRRPGIAIIIDGDLAHGDIVYPSPHT